MTSGVLIEQTCPHGELTQLPVLSFIAQPNPFQHRCLLGEVMFVSGRTELPLAAVVSFK
ncbi:MAG: hypothetical protein ACR2KJ_13165 [Jatrophihabitans sp.]